MTPLTDAELKQLRSWIDQAKADDMLALAVSVKMLDSAEATIRELQRESRVQKRALEIAEGAMWRSVTSPLPDYKHWLSQAQQELEAEG